MSVLSPRIMRGRKERGETMGIFDKLKKDATEVKEDVKTAEKEAAEKAAAKKAAMEKAASQAKSDALKVADAATKKAEAEKYKLVVDGGWGPLTTSTTQYLLGCTIDGGLGPETISAIQKKVGATVDGDWGTETTSKMQEFLGVEVDGGLGPVTVSAWQTWCNKQLGF